MAKVLIADEINEEGIELLAQSHDVTYKPSISPTELLESVAGFDAVVVRSRTQITQEVIRRGTNLKAIGRAGVGVDNVDIQAATEAGILVINSPEGNTASAAEHTVALMLSLARMVPTADSSVKSGKWERNRFIGCELFNKTLGIIGLGKIGTRVGSTAQALGMKVLVYDPLVTSERASELNMQGVSLEEIWRRADFITLHTPKTHETTNLISASVLSRVKPGVRIINTARGGIIDEVALAKSIRDGRVAGAALDVFENEPPVGSALAELGDRVVLTPHLGASTIEAQFSVALDLAEQLRDYLAGGMPRNPVNLPFMRQEVLKSLGKYLWLSEAMGAIAGELAEGAIKEIEIIVCGGLAEKDTSPLVVAALRGMFSRRVEGVTYVNAHVIARNHGIQVRESKFDEAGQYRDEVTVIVSTAGGASTTSGTVLPHDEPIVTKINDFPINLTPARYMLFTTHKDQPGMVAKVAGVLGNYNINISTMAVGRRKVRQDAVMVMTLDDPLAPELISEFSKLQGLHMAKYVSLDQLT